MRGLAIMHGTQSLSRPYHNIGPPDLSVHGMYDNE